eukprot:2637520-Rhodomonas_salina.1
MHRQKTAFLPTSVPYSPSRPRLRTPMLSVLLFLVFIHVPSVSGWIHVPSCNPWFNTNINAGTATCSGVDFRPSLPPLSPSLFLARVQRLGRQHSLSLRAQAGVGGGGGDRRGGGVTVRDAEPNFVDDEVASAIWLYALCDAH